MVSLRTNLPQSDEAIDVITANTLLELQSDVARLHRRNRIQTWVGLGCFIGLFAGCLILWSQTLDYLRETSPVSERPSE